MRPSIISTIVIAGAALAACADPAEPVLDPGDLLSRSDAEPAGANCAEGGTAVRIGHDANHNGELDGGEVERVEYVCNPTPTSTPTLVRQDPLPAGTVCPAGGTAVHTGRDLDSDGVLDDDEIEQTVTVCDVQELWTGNITTSAWSTPEAQAALAQVRVIIGNLTIDNDVALPALEFVSGRVAIEGGASIQVPALREVVGELRHSSVVLAQLSLPHLEQLGGTFRIEGGAPNSSVSAPLLVRIGGDLRVSAAVSSVMLPGLDEVGGALWVDDGDLSDLQLAALTTIGGSLEVRAPALESLALDSLVQVGQDIQITYTMLTELEAPALRHVGSGVSIDNGLYVAHNALLATIELPTLFGVDGPIFVSNNDALTAVKFPALEAAPALTVQVSGALTAVRAPKLASTRDLQLVGLPQLATLDLAALTTVEHELLLSSTGLPNLSGLSSLTYALSIDLYDDDQLVNLHGLELLHSVGGIVISRCDGLVSVAGLDNLVRTTSFLFLRYNPALANLGALSSLTYVGGILLVEDNDQLVSLAGLDHVATVGDDLLIIDNAKLASLSLGMLTSLNDTFRIESNPLLPATEIARLQAQLGL